LTVAELIAKLQELPQDLEVTQRVFAEEVYVDYYDDPVTELEELDGHVVLNPVN
jgi:hypothetical protein